jgi:predicted GNAT family acetyltransferase
VGSHQPVGDVTEVVGVATLPAFRRRGIGAAITAALVADARRRGVDMILLSAGSDEVARVYAKVGFVRMEGSARQRGLRSLAALQDDEGARAGFVIW